MLWWIISLVILMYGCDDTKEIIEYYENGNIKSIKKVRICNNKIDTLNVIEYYDNGKIRCTGEYRNNLKNGKWVYYYSNGNIWSKGNFVNGKSEGKFYVYNSDGSLFMVSSYKQGVPDGEWLFFENNKIIKTIIFKNGKKILEKNESNIL